MRVGVYGEYLRCDKTLTLLQAARVALEMGHDVEFLTISKPVPVHPIWDRYVIKRQSFHDWICGIDYLISGEPLTEDLLKHVKSKRVRAYFVCLYDELEDHLSHHLDHFDIVVCPARRASRLLTDYLRLNNVLYVPWDVGLPLTRNPFDLEPERIGVIWPLDMTGPPRQEAKFFRVIETALSSCKQLFLTIACGELTPSALKALKKISRNGDGRLEVTKTWPYEKLYCLYGQHDLTLWPTLSEGAGTTGLSSLSMGTPVLAFDHPIVGEIVRDGQNGILVPCDLEYNWLGVPRVRPDYELFTKYLLDVLAKPKQLEDLRLGTLAGLQSRRDLFRQGWIELLNH